MKTVKLVFGTSNICRLFETKEKRKGYSVIRCTNKQLCKVRLACLEEGDEYVTVAVIENIICDGMQGVDASKVDILYL